MPDISNTIQNTVIDTTMGAAVGATAGDIATDVLLDELIDALVEQYAKASLQMQEKCDKYFGKYVEEDKKKRALLDAGKISKDDYRAWQNSKALGSKQWMDMRDTLAQDLTNCNEIAADIINDRKCDIYALNHNYGMYEIEHDVGAYTSYTLYDHDTVERLIAQNPEILPKAKIDIPKDLRWNKHLLTSAVTQGILQGESIPAIAKRMASVTDMGKDAAIRNARTATTGAQNAGRVDSYKHAEKLGIKVTQIWISTLDGRTRTSHRHLMGQKRPLGKPFSNGLLFPGDPNGPGWEVYNCRCTLIAEPDGSGYDLEKTIDKNLSKKGMTFDEWLNEQPLSKHYGESKRHYLERYSEYKKNLSFADWLEEQAAPDSVIQSIWGDKKYSYVYNLMKNSTAPGHGADANNFFNALKDLGQKSGIGNPPQVWNAYMTGQLDAEDLKTFEDIIKKYLPKQADNISDVAKAADKVDNIVDTATKISKEAQDSLDKLKLKAGNPMDKDAADNYKVNPFYEKGIEATTKNCQTTAYAYECRRQGYDVIASPKWGLNYDDPEFKKMLKLQEELGQNQRLGWINKETGHPATVVLEQTNKDFIATHADIIKDLENAVGKDGERYIMGVRWKKNGAHAINVDRTPDGKLRIIDNQRGPLEKNTWVGKEAEEYLEKVKNIKHLTRVDDCIPKSEYFNNILLDPKKVKTGVPTKISGADPNYSKLYKIAKAKNEKPSIYYTKWKSGMIDDPDLDDLFVAKKTATKIDIPTVQAKTLANDALDIDAFKNKSASAVWKELNANKAGGGKFWNDITDIGKANGMKPAEVWKKYLAGELDADDVKKIESHLVKIYKKANLPDILKKTDLIDPMTGEVLNKIEEFEKIKKMPITDLDDMANKLTKDYYGLKVDDAKEILKGSGLDIPEKTAATNNIAEIAKKELGDFSGQWIHVYFEVSDIDSDLADELKDVANKIKHDEGFVNKNKVLSAYFDGTLKSTELDDIFTKIYKDKIPMTSAVSKVTDKAAAVDMDLLKTKTVSKVWNELKAQGGTAYSQFWKTIGEAGKDYGLEKKQSKVWEMYLNGKLKPDESKKIDDFLLKHYFNKTGNVIDYSKFGGKEVYDTLKKYSSIDDFLFNAPSAECDKIVKLFHNNDDEVQAAIDEIKKLEKAKATTKTAEKSDELIKAEEKLKKAQDELKATEKALKDNIPDYDHVYKGIWKDPVTLEDYEKKKSTVAAKKIYYEEEIDKLKNDPNYKSWLDSSAKSAEINKLDAYLYDLEEYDKLGQKAEKYLSDIEKAKNAVTKAQQEVQKYSPSSFSTSYAQERKNAALWPKSRDEADKLYMARSQKEWKAAKPAERAAIKEYTSSYHKFNEPLRGIEYGTNKYKGVGNTDLNASYANNGKMLNDMTDYLEKCVSDQDQWLQRGCGWGGMDKFLNVDMSLLQKGSEKELQNALLGKTITEYGFMSAGSAKGKGFSGDILFNIFAPKGTKMSYAELYSHYKGGSEVETILQQGSQFIITKVEKTKSQIYIDIELVNQLEPQRWKP